MPPDVRIFAGWSLGAAAAAQRPGARLLEGPNALSYGEVAELAARTGAWLASHGLGHGSRVAFAVSDDALFASLLVGMLRHGVVPLVLDPGAAPREAQELLAFTEPDAVLVDVPLAEAWAPADHLPDGAPVLLAARSPAPSLRERLAGLAGRAPAPDPRSFPAALAAVVPAAPPPPPAPADLAYVLFTSGSTARPKGVEITHGALAAHMATFARRFGYGPTSHLLNILPLHHTDGLFNGLLAAFACGGTLIRPFAYAIERTGALEDALYFHRVTHFVAVPTLLGLLVRLAAAPGSRPPALQMIISSAAPLEPALWEAAEARWQVPVVNVYGLTETVCGSLYAGPDDESRVIGTIGVPDGCEARLVDGAGAPVGDDVVGELQLAGPHLMRGYHRDPAATAEVLEAGWFATGDLASRDAAGRYRLHGRSKHVVITGGHNVSPEEVATVLAGHPAVAEAAAVGRPDPIWGEVVVAFVAPATGPVDVDALMARCRERLAAYKVPASIRVVQTLPREGPTGKVRFAELRALAATEDQAPAAPAGGAVARRVLELAARCFRVRPADLTLDATPEHIGGWTSLAHLGLVNAIERTFDVALSTREVMALTSLRAAVTLVERKLAEGPGSRP